MPLHQSTCGMHTPHARKILDCAQPTSSAASSPGLHHATSGTSLPRSRTCV